MNLSTPPLAAQDDSPSLQDKFRQGVALHQQGRFAEAELIYRDVLQQEPASFEAMHLLDVIAFQTRKTPQAVELIGKAITLDPAVATAHTAILAPRSSRCSATRRRWRASTKRLG